MNAVALEVNQANLVKHLKLAFTNRTTFLQELLQNARRAGATKIDLEFSQEEDRLVIRDNGIGVENMQHIFTVAQSGWDDEIVQREGAYGIGFMSALFAARKVTITSRGKRVMFDTEAALNFESLAVESVETGEEGACIVLEGLDEKFWQYGEYAFQRLEQICVGFPVPITCNGVEFVREHAIDSDKRFEKLSIGMAYLVGIEEDFDTSGGNIPADMDTTYYLQGFKVGTSNGMVHRKGNVVHLDPTQFVGRLPDRDSLVDHRDCIRLANDVVRSRWQERLREIAAQTDQKRLAEVGYPILSRYGLLDVFNQNPYLPKQALYRYESYPILSNFETGLVSYGDVIHRDELKDIAVYTLDDFPYEGDSFGAVMWVYRQEGIVLDGRLDEGHWANDAECGIHFVTNKDIWLELVEPGPEEFFSCHWQRQDVMFCTKAILHKGEAQVEVAEGFRYVGPVGSLESEEDSYFLVIPDSERTGQAIEQGFNYHPSDADVPSSERDDDMEDLRRLILSNVKDGELDVLKSVLVDAVIGGYAQGTYQIEIKGYEVEVKKVQ